VTRQFMVTYVQELAQPISTGTIEQAANYAKTYARNNHLVVLQIIEVPPAPAVGWDANGSPVP
jgi:hypothetical protein